MNPTLTAACRAFPADQAMRHRMRPDCRESLAHMLVFPEHGIAGFIYPSVRSDGMAKARASLFGPGLRDPIHEQVEASVDASQDFDDWRMGPLRMAVREPHRRVELSWSGSRIRFEGRYEALHPPYAFSLHPEGNPPYYGDNRTEQHGRLLDARLAVEGRTLEVGGYLIRDHSWGPRIWGLNQHYKWLHATSANCAIHVFEMQSFGRRQLRGFLFRDGEMHHVVEADFDHRFDDQMMQTAVDVVIVDDAGRRARIVGQAIANIQLEFDPMVWLNEAPLKLEIDGQAGTGWCEYCWNRDYLRFARQHALQYGNGGPRLG